MIKNKPNATTKKIMLIRHAEKPVGNFQGVTVKGNQDPESLIVMGWQRAGALVVLFDLDPDKSEYLFSQVPQNLLPGDQNTIIPKQPS